MIDITLLGTGGGMPMPDRFLSALLLNYNSHRILIDCGEGTQVAMKKYKSGFKNLDLILLTHCHGDHIFGLSGLLSTLGNYDRTRPLRIIGPKGTAEIVRGLIVSLLYLPYEIEIIESPETPLNIFINSNDLVLSLELPDDEHNPQIILRTLDLDHSISCLGYSLYFPRRPKFYPERAKDEKIPLKYWGRLQRGETITDGDRIYKPSMVLGKERKGIKISCITDTRPIDLIVPFIQNSDLFLCEGTYGDPGDLEKAIMNKHMTFQEAADLAQRGNVKELWLTHFSPSMDEPKLYLKNALNVFPNTILGEDGLTKSLNYPE